MIGKCPQCGARVDTRLWWCTECGFAMGDPNAVLPADAVLEPDVWREGELLVMRIGARLPGRCLATNDPADGGNIRVPLVWYPHAVHWAHLGGTIPFLIVALSLRKSATIEVPVSRRWRAMRRRSAVLAWMLAIAGLAVFSAGKPLGGLQTINWPLMAIGAGLFVFGVSYGACRLQNIGVAQMTDTHAWLSGVNRQYLAALPQHNDR